MYSLCEFRPADCDCQQFENQVCDVCQGVDPNNPPLDRRRGLICNGKTPRGQRFFGFDFGRFAVGVLLDG